ncbi:MAG: hypothetical protein HY700_03825 [Gemmatimonadetes bacterium]|nr:hypothetical protein [Gemmatimonadota bacterium]
MKTLNRSGLSLRLRPALFALGAVAALAGCNEQKIQTGFEGDITPPIVAITKTQGDTMDVSQGLQFSVSAADNLGLKTISVVLTGGYAAQVDTTFRTAVTNVTLPVLVTFPKNTTAGGRVYIRVTATDGNNNSVIAQDSVFLTNIDALIVTLIRPQTGAIASPGKQVLVQVQGSQKQGVKKLGWIAAGGVTDADSALFSPPGLPDTGFFVDTFTVPASVTSGTFTVGGFGEDSSGRRVLTPTVTVTIQSVATDNTPPAVSFTVLDRVEVRDSITVRATDPSGITLIGWTATDQSTGAVAGGDSVTSGGSLTDVTFQSNLNLSFPSFPRQVIIGAFAVDAAGNRGEATTGTGPTAPVRRDTITVVNGITKALPAGGQIADAIYNRNLNELYLTNVALDRLEVFSVTDTAFKTSIATGSKPWGIALWPRDTLGTNADTVVVANSGGTNLSIIDLQIRRERRRHALPNFLVSDIQAVRDPQTGAISGFKEDDFDFSDRPEYLGMVCRPGGGLTTCASDSLYAVYSTTPTIDQGTRFKLRGSVRWENLTSALPESHFFWEHARPSPLADTLFEYPDTIQIVADGGGRSSPETLIGASCFLSVILDNLAFRDTTFVRNSGNFTHALVGEGGDVITAGTFARVVAFNSAAGVSTRACPAFGTFIPASIVLRENGVSPGRHVSDFISNTAVPVHSIATNFNGLTSLVRTDSVYVINNALRLTGIIQSSGSNPGMDLNFDHKFNADVGGTAGTFTGTLNPNDRLAFLARADASVDVFDTFFFGRVATIPLRDPVIGPIRVAKLGTGEQILVGVTARGVVIARLPTITNIYQARAWGEPVSP